MNQPKHSPDTLGSEIDDNLDREVDMILKEISERDSNERGSNEKNVGGTISTAQSRFTGLKNALRHVKDTFNYYYEMAISKTLARFLIGSEIDGPLQYKAPERWTNTDNDNLVHENIIRVETSITLDTRKDSWGLERIALDTVSNHLPEDCGGTSVCIEYLQDDIWTDRESISLERDVDAIRVKDDGLGFDHRLLEILYSTKTDQKRAVGQFGEGIKLVSAACIRNGINIEYHSRDWSARPYTTEEVIGITTIVDGKPFIEDRTIQRLCFEKRIGLPKFNGSETIFYNPSLDLVAEFYALPDTLLALNKKHNILFSEDYDGYAEKIIKLLDDEAEIFGEEADISDKKVEIFDEKSDTFIPVEQDYYISDDQFIFVKGVRIESATDKIKLLFSYDIGIEEITPDRQFIDIESAKKNIRRLLLACKDIEVYKDILSYGNSEPDVEYLEYLVLEDAASQDSADKESWRSAFYSLFGDNAILESKHLEADMDARGVYGYSVIKLNPRIKNFLHKNEIIKDSMDILKTYKEYEWSSNLTEEERKVLEMIPLINRIPFINSMLGLGDVLPNVRVFDGCYIISYNQDEEEVFREEIPRGDGYYLKKDPLNPDQDLIAIKRSRLSSFENLVFAYVHELGHKLSGARDYTREFDNYFTDVIVRAIMQYLGEGLYKK